MSLPPEFSQTNRLAVRGVKPNEHALRTRRKYPTGLVVGMVKPSLVIVGNGMVGQRFVDEAIQRGLENSWDIVVIGEEQQPAYDRVALSSWFDDQDDSALSLVERSFVDDGPVEYRLGVRVDSIDRGQQTLQLSDDSELAYDHLVLATGSYPFVPPVPGKDLPGVFVYRTLEDLANIQSWVTDQKCSTGVIIGGGLLGLEAANALRNMQVSANVVEMAPRLMPQQLEAGGSEMLSRWIDDLGVSQYCGVLTEEIVGSDRGVTGLRFAESEALAGMDGIVGNTLATDIVIFSAGIRASDSLGRDAGLEIGERGGVVTDTQMVTSDPNISAIGEVACVNNMLYGLVGPGYDMAKVAADRLAKSPTENGFAGADLSAKLKLLGVEVASFGDNKGNETTTDIVFVDPVKKVHRRLVLDNENQVVGGTLVGDASGYDILVAMARGQMVTPDEPQSFVLPDYVGANASSDVELPDSAQICSCNDVTKGDLKEAIGNGCQTVGSLKSETLCGTSCGGCVPAMETLLKVELANAGIEVKVDLCEHFAYSRQQLFDLVRFHGHSSWAEVISAHGSGRGCAICRPAVASILASLSNGYVLDESQASLQDTNDRSLANMQRNGTYSIIPRVPGGEITPDQLIELGQIAKDFDLYTKITGGQRIDLLGAELSELPAIWQRVLDAGLESGHAYGKALRTVKSCVGSTWCRYGVQDSVTMAINVELRYRGLRSPHKLKSAVSGCTRECAEAQSKDFGIIATETGWNLYVGGNGGRQPRHADLIGTDLDDATLIRTIDRFLMFYIRTADKLQRTSLWLESLEGGIDYLKEVIFEDSLGICDELDADMAKHVDTYKCEWQETLESPERLGQFVEFVNAPEETSTPVWIRERGQKAPAPAPGETEELVIAGGS